MLDEVLKKVDSEIDSDSQTPFIMKNVLKNLYSWDELETLLNSSHCNFDRFHCVWTAKEYRSDQELFVIKTKPTRESCIDEINMPLYTKNLEDHEYTWENKFTPWVKDNTAIPVEILQKLMLERACYISDCSRISKKINYICKRLESEYRSADAHIYFSLANKFDKEYGIHYDVSHNFIVQIEGQTRWKIWKDKAKTEDRLVDHLDVKPMIDEEVFPGDVLFIPRKHWHDANSKTKRISISFPITESYDSSEIVSEDRKKMLKKIRQSRKWLKIN